MPNIDERMVKNYFNDWNRDSPFYQWIERPMVTASSNTTSSFPYYDQGTTSGTGFTTNWDTTTNTYSVPSPTIDVRVEDDVFAKVKRFRAEVSVSEAMLRASASTKKLGDAFAALGPAIQANLENCIGRTLRGESPIARPEEITYKAPPREFNAFLNASDQLEAFIKYVGTLGVRQSEVLGLPLDLFVKWLILEAAKKDNEPEPEGVVIVIEQPRCLGCQRWMPKCAESRRVPFCEARCLALYQKSHHE